jgi:hypothetical protein
MTEANIVESAWPSKSLLEEGIIRRKSMAELLQKTPIAKEKVNCERISSWFCEGQIF